MKKSKKIEKCDGKLWRKWKIVKENTKENKECDGKPWGKETRKIGKLKQDKKQRCPDTNKYFKPKWKNDQVG